MISGVVQWMRASARYHGVIMRELHTDVSTHKLSSGPIRRLHHCCKRTISRGDVVHNLIDSSYACNVQ